MPEPAEIAACEAVATLDGRPDLPDCFYRVSHAKKRAFLLALTTTPILGAACLAAGISKPTPFNWLKSGDEAFIAAYKVARELGIRAAEDEAWKRATDGTVEDVYGSLGAGLGTGVVGQRRVKSDTMLIFMLKAAAPEKYRERYDHQITGKGGGPVEISRVERVLVDGPEVIDITPGRLLGE